MDADEAKAEWFNAFRNILLFIRANPRKSVAENAVTGSLQWQSAINRTDATHRRPTRIA